jgi:outer membrane protein assembly factor BamB
MKRSILRGTRAGGTAPAARLLTAIAALISCSDVPQQGGDRVGPGEPQGPWRGILTHHNDRERTGANLHEKILNTTNVTRRRFGLLFDLRVDGQVYAQPLYVPNLRFADGAVRNVVYVATQKNKVYAFDADAGGDPIWSADFAEYAEPEHAVPHPSADFGNAFCPKWNVLPSLGITSTPVIDLESGTMYVEAFSGRTAARGPLPSVSPPRAEGCEQFRASANPANRYAHKLHALDLITGEEKFGAPVTVTASVPGLADAAGGGTVSFVAQQQLQRPGLLLNAGRVYLGFGSFSDSPPYHGWVIGFAARDLRGPPAVFNTSPNSGGCGIWQSGQGLAGDADGSIYLATGNGLGRTVEPHYADSFLRLPPQLGPDPIAFYRHPRFQQLAARDLDLGSSGPLLVPGTDWLLGGGKDGYLHVLDKKTLALRQRFLASWIPREGPRDERITCFTRAAAGHIHGAPVLWEGPRGVWIYLWAEYDHPKAFRLNSNGTVDVSPTARANACLPDGPPCGAPVSISPVVAGCGMPGGFLSLSADGSRPGTGILWANHPKADAAHGPRPATLYAFDASDLRRKLWDSDEDPEGSIIAGAKHTPPTIANGRVYMATFANSVRVFGLKAP